MTGIEKSVFWPLFTALLAGYNGESVPNDGQVKMLPVKNFTYVGQVSKMAILGPLKSTANA